MQFHQSIVRFAAFAALVVAPILSGCASDSSGAHVFARRDNGTNIVSRLVPDGTDVATLKAVSTNIALALEPKLDKSGGTVQDLHIQTADNQAWHLTNSGLIKDVKYNPPSGEWHSMWNIEIPYPRDSSSKLALAAEADTFTPGNLAALDSQGNPVDSGVAKSYAEGLVFAQHYPEGNVKSAAEFTPNIKYTLTSNATERTAMVKPFCTTDDPKNDNSGLGGRVVIPPFVDASGYPYISDNGTRFKVVGVSDGIPDGDGLNTNLTAIVAPSTVTIIGESALRSCVSLTSVSFIAATNIGDYAFYYCDALTAVSLPVATSIGVYAFFDSSSLTSVSLPAATGIGSYAFYFCDGLTAVSLPAATNVRNSAFSYCTSLTSVDFGGTPRSDVPTLGMNVFYHVPTNCTIIVPYAQYDAWKAASGWSSLTQEFVYHSEWEYARKYEVDKKLDKKLDTSGGTVTGTLTFLGSPMDPAITSECPIELTDQARLSVYENTSHNDGAVADFSYDCIQHKPQDADDWFALRYPRASGVIALTTPNPDAAGNLAALDDSGNPVDSGIAKTNVLTFVYDVNSNRTAVTVGVPRRNDPNFEAETPAIDGTTGENITVPALVGPHSLAITGDDESDQYRRTVASGEGAIAVNKGVATNRFSVAIGYNTFAAGVAAISHGEMTAALGDYSHSEGYETRAYGDYSHAEGDEAIAFGFGAHAEGYCNEARGAYSHVEGAFAQTSASAWYAHSSGVLASATNHTAYVWQGATYDNGNPDHPDIGVGGNYYSHGLGTYNINPKGGLTGFWIGETNLAQHVANLTALLSGKTMPANPSDVEFRVAVSNIWEALGGKFQ